jgi:hypothetical protein
MPEEPAKPDAPAGAKPHGEDRTLEAKPYEPPKPARSLAGFYVATGAVSLLLLVAVFAYRPLKLRYAIYKVRQNHSRYQVGPMRRPPHADEWLRLCLDEAGSGNREAMRLLIDISGAKLPWHEEEIGSGGDYVTYDVTYPVAKSQPDQFFEVLGERSDAEVLRILWALCQSAHAHAGGPSFFRDGHTARQLVDDLDLLATAKNPEAVRVGAAAAEFARRRFSMELAKEQLLR